MNAVICFASNSKDEIRSSENNENKTRPPILVKSAKPLFPRKAKTQHIEGVVIVKFVVDIDGGVKAPEVVESVPEGVFEESALNTIKKYKFEPALKEGRRVLCWVKQSVVFSLEGSKFGGKASILLSAYRETNNGINYIEKGEYQKALDTLSNVIKEYPKYDLAYYFRSIAFLKNNNPSKALSDIAKSIKLDPDRSFYYSQKATVYDFLKDHQKAIEFFNKAINIDSTNAETYNNRGEQFRKLDNYQKAIDDYTAAIHLDDEYVQAKNNRGYVYYQQGEFENACIDLNSACDLGDCRGYQILQNEGKCPSN